MNKLNKLYAAMLESWGCTFTDDHAITLSTNGLSVPVKVDGKQVYLPTSDNLNGVTIGKVFFHPACESIMSKETEIFKVIRKLTTAKLHVTFQSVFEVLCSVANKKSGKTLSGKMLEQLEPFKGLSKDLKNEVVDIIRAISITVDDQAGFDTRLINFSLIKGGKTDNDETAYYTATPSFPFYTELYRALSQNEHLKPSDRVTFNNKSVSMQALNAVGALFELALPACVDPSRKKYSATSSDAARLIAYLHSYALVASDLNALIGKFRKEFDSIGVYGINLDWVSDLDEVGEIKGLIPALDYNNYNLTAVPESSANSNRITSYNPLHGMFNDSGSNSNNNRQSSHGQQSQPQNGPKVPDALPGETYIGSDYSANNGIHEFRFQQQTGMIRVRRLAEDGRFISEDFQYPQNNQGMAMSPMMNPAMMGMMMSGMQNGMIPLVGMGNMNGGNMVRDPYTGTFVAANNNGVSNNGMNNNNNLGFPDYNAGGLSIGAVDNGY